jgi:hypothetical protein
MANLALSKLPIEKEKWTRPEEATNGNIFNYNGNIGFAAANWPCVYTLDLEMEYRLSVVRFLLWDNLGRPGNRINRRKYKFTLSISSDGLSFTNVFSNENGDGSNGWFSFRFTNDTHARYIRFTGHFNTANEQIHIVEFEVHDQEPYPLTSSNVHNIDVATGTGLPSAVRITEVTNTRENSRILYALSTSSSDSKFTSLGLQNLGLLGYLQTSSNNDAFALEEYHLAFPAGEAYFYTLQKEKENFSNRNVQLLRSLGFARKNPQASFRQLHRFFNTKAQYHLFTVNPDFVGLNAEGWRDESQDNPIYINSLNAKDSQPLFLFSNSSKTYSKSLLIDPAEGDSDSTSSTIVEKIKDAFNVIIRNENVRQARFFFTSEEDNDLTVSIHETFYNFYVNQKATGIYTVKRNPYPPGQSYILNNIQAWNDVENLFREWLTGLPASDLDRISSEIPKSTANGNEKEIETAEPSSVYENSDISLGDSFAIEAALGVETLATEITKIIRNLKSEPGNMIGVFGRWGRGKTRLMNEIWDRLRKANDVRYEQVRYQAWRYQDTPASWAYLYEQFSLAFLGEKNSVKKFFRYHTRLLILNIERQGWWSLILGFFAACAAIVGVMIWTPVDEYVQSLLSKIGISIGGGLIVVISIKNFRQAYLTKAINIISKYGVKTSFKNTLGIQAEIQNELVDLINAWIPNGKKKKIILFVDDLDRCNEAKTIEIIDALRIILDDDELKEKLLILTAIDERILGAAINNKYAESNVDQDTIREYVDKLFIFSVKLGPLDSSQSKDFFQKLVKNDLDEGNSIQSNTIDSDIISKLTPKENSGEHRASNEADRKTAVDLATDKTPVNNTNRIKKLSPAEVELITVNLGMIKNSTPRKIRILYYRYLFAKNLLIINHGDGDQNDRWLEHPYHEHFIKLLIYFSNLDPNEIVDQIRMTLEAESIKSPVDDFAVDKEHYVRLLRILELTIAY